MNMNITIVCHWCLKELPVEENELLEWKIETVGGASPYFSHFKLKPLLRQP